MFRRWRQSDMSFKDVIMVQFIDIHFKPNNKHYN